MPKSCDVHGCTNAAKAWMPKSCDVHGCTNAAKAWMPKSWHVGNAASGDLDHLNMITLLMDLV
ncbi:MAG: hypothetical protein HRT37_23045 [Alteromonadaceae bacterium]|nr:hypothetical protein [Alteromonadaceae bacterium]